MDKWLYDNKRKIKILVLIIFGVVALLYVFCVTYTNVTARRTEYKNYDLGDLFEYRGTDVTINNCKIYKLSEFQKEFDLTENEAPNILMTDSNCIILIVEYEVRKVTEDAKGPDWDNAFIYTKEEGEPTNPIIDMMVFGDRIKISDMEVGDSQTVKVGTYMYKSNLFAETWNNIEKTSFYVYMPDYEGSEYVRRIKIR